MVSLSLLDLSIFSHTYFHWVLQAAANCLTPIAPPLFHARARASLQGCWQDLCSAPAAAGGRPCAHRWAAGASEGAGPHQGLCEGVPRGHSAHLQVR